MWNLSAASNLTFVSQTLSPTAQMFSIEELILAATLYVRMLWKQKQKFLLCATYAIRLFLVPMQAHAVVRRALLLLPYPHYFCSQSNTKMKCWLMYMHSYLYLRFTQQMDHEKERFIILYGDGVKPSPFELLKICEWFCVENFGFSFWKAQTISPLQSTSIMCLCEIFPAWFKLCV